jgi:hypothetical protein
MLFNCFSLRWNYFHLFESIFFGTFEASLSLVSIIALVCLVSRCSLDVSAAPPAPVTHFGAFIADALRNFLVGNEFFCCWRFSVINYVQLPVGRWLWIFFLKKRDACGQPAPLNGTKKSLLSVGGGFGLP